MASVNENVRTAKLAEDILRSWAHEVGITCNKAHEDERGWDFLLEFPDGLCAVEDDVSLDQRPSAPKCQVQVKGTRSERTRKSLKLSNWRDLAVSPLPAFFLVVHLSDDDVCDEAYLVHVWEHQIEHVLRRLRQLEVEGEPSELHKKRMDLTWGDDDELSKPSGDSLAEAICEAINGDMASYVRRKEELRRSLGYEGPPAKMNFTGIIPEKYRDQPHEALVDFGLGLLPSLEVTEGVAFDSRFGLELPTHEFGEGKLEIRESTPVREAMLRLRRSDASEEIGVPAQMYAPSGGISELVPRDQLKLRFDVPYCRLVCQLQSGANFHFTLPQPDEMVELRGLRYVAKLIDFLQRAGLEDDEEIVDIYLDDDWLGNFSVDGTLPGDFVRWAELVRKAEQIARFFGIDEYVCLRTGELYQQEQKLGVAACALAPHRQAMLFRFPSEDDYEPDLMFCFPAFTHLIMGDKRLFLAVAFMGSEFQVMTEDGDKWHDIRCEKATVEQKRILDREDKLPEAPVSVLGSIAQKYADDYQVVIWWEEE